MEIGVVVERVERVAAVRADPAAGVPDLEAALRDVGKLQSWLTSTKAVLTSKVAAQVSFPEKTIADCTRGTTNDAIKDRERSTTLDAAPSLAEALDEGAVTAGHVDEVTRATKGLDGDQRGELFDRLDQGLLDIAAVATVEDWRRRLALEVRNIQRDDGVDRLTRQRKAVRVRTWTDSDGMWCLSGRFDPVTGIKLSAKIDAAVNALFAEHTPDTCPSDPVEKQQHLAGLAVASLLDNHGTGAGKPGRPEYIIVIDSTSPDGAGGPVIDCGIPVEIPYRILTDMIGDGNVDVHAVVVRNGVIIHAPGELNLGRTTRLANRAQRRALRALYSTCAIPGCRVRYDRCKLHHIIWWRNGGRTDLDNLLPCCPQHHTRIHDHNWHITLGPNRELTITFPDGTIHNTGPPKRTAA
jgi:hypothetical protein